MKNRTITEDQFRRGQICFEDLQICHCEENKAARIKELEEEVQRVSKCYRSIREQLNPAEAIVCGKGDTITVQCNEMEALKEKVEELEEALTEITMGNGRYSRDPLTHAEIGRAHV